MNKGRPSNPLSFLLAKEEVRASRDPKPLAEQFEPRTAQLRLKGEPPCRPFGRPNESQRHCTDHQSLAPENFASRHDDGRSI